MPRSRREESVMGIYHVILRGNNRQIVFQDENDFLYFLSVLKKIQEETEFQLYSYCLMSNHVHLLMKEGKENLGETLKRIETNFVAWYNRKYERCGVLFQGRFKSEPVNTEKYFLTAWRYIMQNPMHAGLESLPGKSYPWSSCRAYLGRDNMPSQTNPRAAEYAEILTEQEAIKARLPEIKEFLCQESRENCMEYYSMCEISDEDAIKLMQRITEVKSPYEFLRLEIKKRDQKIVALKEAGFSVAQISRYTGISAKIIRKALPVKKGTGKGEKGTVPD